MKVLVTGGAGFIGSHVVDKALAAGHSALVVDNLSTGNPKNVSASAELFRIDVLDADPLFELIGTERPDAVLHLAAQINVRVSIREPVRDARENILGGLHVLEGCLKHGVRRFVFASSGGAIYGDQSQLPFEESVPPRPASPYGVSKLAMELYGRCFQGTSGLEVVNLRLANVYGPRQDPRGEAGVISIFVDRMLRKEIPRIFGDGRQTRDYVYVEDVAAAFERALTAPAGTYNIGTGRETSVNALFDILKAQMGFAAEATHEAPIAGEVARSALRCEKAARLLKWTPEMSLEEGLAKTVRFFSPA
ncbi:MAG: NAD-dependent epimerase/dehydratase family protein [Planctomycetes bacterium]|nr:NAD-dependent epimerase/dehydratase family protein [Planctomycetota bacterium]